MATITLVAKLDLDADGVFEEDISTDILLASGLSLTGRGRQKELDAAGMSILVVNLKNRTGKFTPRNTGSSIYPDFKPLIGIDVDITFNAITYDFFQGFATVIDLEPMPREQSVKLTCADAFFILKRNDTRLPLMRDHRTGLVINRLLDYAERGEILTNARFKDDESGYAAIGGASAPVYATTGGFLHESAAMDVTVSNAAGSGWSNVVTAATAQGDRVTGAVYVWAEDPAAEGKVLKIEIRDNGGLRGSDTITLTGEPQRVDAAGVYDGASTTRQIDCVTNSAQGVFTFRTGAAHAVPSAASIDRDIDDGDHRIANAQYHRIKALAAIQQIRDNELGGFFYMAPDGKATFEEQSHRWHETPSTVSQEAFDESFQDLKYREAAIDRISEVILDHPRYVEGAAGERIFSLDRVPILEPTGGADLTVEADFSGGLVRDIITPVSGVDFIYNAAADGSGADESANVTIEFETYGGGARAVFTNTVARFVYLTTYKIRGTAIRLAQDKTPVRVSASTPSPITNELVHNYAKQANRPSVQSWGDYLAERFGDTQRERIGMRLKATWPDAELTSFMPSILGRLLSDRVTISNDDAAHSAKLTAATFYLDSIGVMITKGSIKGAYTLVPTDVDMMIWDSSSWDSAAVWAP